MYFMTRETLERQEKKRKAQEEKEVHANVVQLPVYLPQETYEKLHELFYGVFEEVAQKAVKSVIDNSDELKSRYISKGELMQMFNVSNTTIAQFHAMGLKRIKLGNKRYYDTNDVIELLDGLKYHDEME